MKSKIIAFKTITSKAVDASYRIMLASINANLEDIQTSINRIKPIVNSYQKDEQAAVMKCKKEIEYINNTINDCMTILKDFDLSLGNKYLASENSAEKSKNTIFEKRHKFLKIYQELLTLLNNLADEIVEHNGNLDDFNIFREDFRKIYDEINETLPLIKNQTAALRIQLRL